MPKNTAPLPDWELVLSSAARLQRILPDAVLVGGTASAIHAEHLFSRDAGHVLAELESVAGWKTARVQRPVQILGSLDGIETGVRQLIRDEPLETAVVDYHGARITVPTEGEILRIKGVLILKRNGVNRIRLKVWNEPGKYAEFPSDQSGPEGYNNPAHVVAMAKRAEAAGLTLIALARPDTFEIFTHAARIRPEEAAHVA